MNHHDATPLLDPYLDGELDLTTCLALEAHLAGCPLCQSALAGQRELVAATREFAPRHPAPPALRDRVGALVQPPAAPERWWRRPPRPWALPVAALAGAAAAWAVLAVPSSRRPAGWAEEAVADHVRSLQASHLMDVASTDRHTVKPWFAGKLDFSPPVVDLAAAGYPLVGGRLDRLAGRDVAALVYRRRKHEINLFIWPSAGHEAGPAGLERDGFHVRAWTQAGMAFVAVSDLGEDELREFARLLREQTPDSRPGE